MSGKSMAGLLAIHSPLKDSLPALGTIQQYNGKQYMFVCAAEEVPAFQPVKFLAGFHVVPSKATAGKPDYYDADWDGDRVPQGYCFWVELIKERREITAGGIVLPVVESSRNPAVGPWMGTIPVRKTEALRDDSGKTRYDLIAPLALEELAKVYTFGATKYAEDNWRKGFSWRRTFSAMMRHAWAWIRGLDIDAESQCHHLAHVAWGCFTLIEFAKLGLGKDDRVGHYTGPPAPKEAAAAAQDLHDYGP